MGRAPLLNTALCLHAAHPEFIHSSRHPPTTFPSSATCFVQALQGHYNFLYMQQAGTTTEPMSARL